MDGPKKKKIALILSYNGTGYSGLQVNPGTTTIESVLEDALHRAGGISDANAGDLKKIGWARTARTDKGVHAACNVVTLKLLMTENIIQLANDLLPPRIRIMHCLKVGKTFNAKSAATSRTYLYIIPSFAFSKLEVSVKPRIGEAEPSTDGEAAGVEWKETEEEKSAREEADAKRQAETQKTMMTFRLDEATKNKISELLNAYCGTKNYHNFTTKKEPGDKSNMR